MPLTIKHAGGHVEFNDQAVDKIVDKFLSQPLTDTGEPMTMRELIAAGLMAQTNMHSGCAIATAPFMVAHSLRLAFGEIADDG